MATKTSFKGKSTTNSQREGAKTKISALQADKGKVSKVPQLSKFDSTDLAILRP